MEGQSWIDPTSLPQYSGSLYVGKESGHIFKFDIPKSTVLTYHSYSRNPVIITVSCYDSNIRIQVHLPAWRGIKSGMSALCLSNCPISNPDWQHDLHCLTDIPDGQGFEYTAILHTDRLKLDFTKGIYVGLVNYQTESIV